jgi:hypothetical protein
MATTAPLRSVEPALNRLPGTSPALAIALTAWFALIVLLGFNGEFVSPPGTPPLPIAIGVLAPIAVFFALLWRSHFFREFVLTADLRLIVGIQAWRFAGMGFLALYTHKVLPGSFALPAGLGDIAIALTAPWVVVALIRRPSFAASTAFIAWNALGILDQFVAVGTGALGSALATGAAREISTAPMAQLPLVLIPAFLVPIFIMLHAAALMQARRVASALLERGSDELEDDRLALKSNR